MKFPSLDPLSLLLTELETRMIWKLKAFKQILDSYILEISHRGVPASKVYTFKKKKKRFKVVLCPNLLPLISISPLNNLSGLTPSRKSL